MQASTKKDGSIDVYLVKDGKKEFITTVNERAEQDIRTYYERKGLGKFIRIEPVITEEDKKIMQELSAKISVPPVNQEPIKLDFEVPVPQAEKQKQKTQFINAWQP